MAKVEPPPIDPATACGPETAASAPLRRLTREQYINSVADLLGPTDSRLAGDLRGVSRVSGTTLPADEHAGPFRSNVVAAPTRLDVEQLMEAAEKLASAAAPGLAEALACQDAEPMASCAERFVSEFGLRAYRRPLRAQERERYQRLFVSAATREGARGGIRAVVHALLQSPYFLMHTRQDEPSANLPPGVFALGPYALASRLSYLLWASTPDQALLQAAERGELGTPEGLRAQTRRLLADDRVGRGLTSFHLQWLDVEDVASVPKRHKDFPAWRMKGASELGRALRLETERFVSHVIRKGDGRLDTLLSAPFSFLDGPLFAYYGVPRPADHDPLRPVALDPRQRAGLLTHGSVLAFHAHAGQTSPVGRGVLIRRRLLCQDLPDPPPDVDSTPPDPDGKLTTRERFEEHRLNGVCSGCHKLIDPIGFGFERYDAIGQYRTHDAGKPVDATGTIVKAGDLDGDFDGAVELARKLAASTQVRACYVRQWFRYALGRLETEGDACTLRALEDHFDRSGRDVRALLLALPTTAAFRYRRLDHAAAVSMTEDAR